MARKNTKNEIINEKPVETTPIISKSKASLTGGNVLSYTGLINITYTTLDGKVINFRKHNKGLPAMFKYLCKALSGNFSNMSSEKPTYLDLKCAYPNSTTGITEVVSCLYNQLSLSKPEYTYDTNLQSWITRFNITLAYNMINYDIVDAHLNSGTFYLYIVSSNGNDFAELELEDSGLILTKITPGTKALIEWTMLIQNG